MKGEKLELVVVLVDSCNNRDPLDHLERCTLQSSLENGQWGKSLDRMEETRPGWIDICVCLLVKCQASSSLDLGVHALQSGNRPYT